MPVNQIEFAELEEAISKTGKSYRDQLAPDKWKVYIVAITRDGCPACEKQKPKLNVLANNLIKKDGNRLHFIRVHIKQPSGDTRESLRSKDVFDHYFYPTNLILYRTEDRGTVELYRNVAPRMSELRRNIEVALKILAST